MGCSLTAKPELAALVSPSGSSLSIRFWKTSSGFSTREHKSTKAVGGTPAVGSEFENELDALTVLVASAECLLWIGELASWPVEICSASEPLVKVSEGRV